MEVAFLDVAATLLTFEIVGLIAAGVVLGILVGMLPGLSATMAIALLLPVTYSMDATSSISMLVAIFVGGISGGCVSAILLRIPGTPNSVATVLDGFAMAQQGRAARALGLAVMASFLGTLFSTIILILAAPTLAKLALKFHFPEYVAAFFFALMAVTAVSGSSLSKGLMSAVLGIIFATAGISSIDGLPRFDFGFREMLGGFPLVPTLVGLFAVSQIMKDTLSPGATQKLKQDIGWRNMLPRLADIREQAGNILRSSAIGTSVGILPAVGGGPAGLIAYAQARNASKQPEKFGKGSAHGIVAAESANNATIGGALITALTLGIPGDTVTAMLIGGLMIQGVQPGPLMFINNPDVVYAIYISVLLSSLMMLIFMVFATQAIVKVLEVPKVLLLPALFIIACVGIYSINGRIFDLWVMCGFGLLGYLLEHFRYPLAPFILGFLLGPPFESNLRKMLGESESLMPLVTRPVPIILILCALLFLAFSIKARRLEAENRRIRETS